MAATLPCGTRLRTNPAGPTPAPDMVIRRPCRSASPIAEPTDPNVRDSAAVPAIPPWALDDSRPGEGTPLAAPLRLTIDMVLAARRWRALLDDRLRPLGQSAARMEAMAVISRSPPDSAQIEIARRIGIEGATFTRMLDALEADEMVERRPHPTDRRTKLIRLTPSGESALAEILAVADRLRTQLLAGIDVGEVDRANLFLEALLWRMDEGLPAPERRC
jgi:MarR family transcriptional regulator for hemolysin